MAESQHVVSVFLERAFFPMPECRNHFKQAVFGSHHGIQARTERGLSDAWGR